VLVVYHILIGVANYILLLLGHLFHFHHAQVEALLVHFQQHFQQHFQLHFFQQHFQLHFQQHFPLVVEAFLDAFPLVEACLDVLLKEAFPLVTSYHVNPFLQVEAYLDDSFLVVPFLQVEAYLDDPFLVVPFLQVEACLDDLMEIHVRVVAFQDDVLVEVIHDGQVVFVTYLALTFFSYVLQL